MKLKNMWKRFWTLDVHNHEGFTLVELIIVIAILAILSTGAIAGYSAYIESANKTTDEALAAEIKNALVLAMYSGELTSGDYVVIKFGERAEFGNSNSNANNDVNSTIYKAMSAAYGDGWENALKLKWNGWDLGAVGDSGKMAIVKDSNFSPDNMDKLLDQLQGVVGDAAGYLSGNIQVSKEIAALLNQNGISINEGDTLDANNSMAAANAYVYLVASELANYDFELDAEGEMDANSAIFLGSWIDGEADFSATSLDSITADAARYANILALATYIDNNAGAGTDFASRLNVSADPRDDADAILAEIKASTDSKVQDAYNAYFAEDPTTGMSASYNDATAFLTYMQGVTDSSSNLLQNTDLSNNHYFVDGYVSDYVNSYLSVSDALIGSDFEGSAIAFFCVADDIVCMSGTNED